MGDLFYGRGFVMTTFDCVIKILWIEADAQFSILSSGDCQTADPIRWLSDASDHSLLLHAL